MREKEREECERIIVASESIVCTKGDLQRGSQWFGWLYELMLSLFIISDVCSEGGPVMGIKRLFETSWSRRKVSICWVELTQWTQ